MEYNTARVYMKGERRKKYRQVVAELELLAVQYKRLINSLTFGSLSESEVMLTPTTLPVIRCQG